jgi:type II secretory pathway pseudopilin PulG
MKTERTAIARAELIVIIVIIILAPSILTATLNSARALAKIPLCQNNLKQIGAAVYQYAQIYDGNLPNVLDATHDEEFHPYAAYRGDGPNHFVNQDTRGRMIPYRLACLYEAKLIEPKLFYCPASTNPYLRYKSYTEPYPPNTSYEWGTLPQLFNVNGNQWVRVGYEWFPVDRDPDLERYSFDGRPKAPKHLCRRFDDVDPNLPYLVDFITYKDYFGHHYKQAPGINTTYIDGHVEYCDEPDVFNDPDWDISADGKSYHIKRSIYYYRILLLSGQEIPTQ